MIICICFRRLNDVNKLFIEMYSEPIETFKMEFLAKVNDGSQPLPVFAKCAILDA